MQFDLNGKTALITGGAKRLGRATTLSLAGAGANIIVHYNSSPNDAEDTANLARNLGVNAYTLKADLQDRASLDELVQRAYDLAGPMDILINNASIFPESSFEDFSIEELEKNVFVNSWAPLTLSRHFVKQNQAGHIINFLDTRIAGYDWKHAAYHASKSMLELFTRMMAIKFAPGFTVNAVAPGLVMPPEGKDEEYLKALSINLPLKKVGSIRDVTESVLFLVSSSYITGQIIFIDGGRHLNEAIIG